MNRLIKYILGGIFISFFLHSCVYHYMTHMNEEELEWITNRQEGELMYFKSTNGDFDTLYIKEIWIHNALDPINWGYFNTSSNDYIAQAQIRYYVKKRNDGGILEIVKLDRNGPISFSSILFDGWLYDVPLDLSRLQVNGIFLNDIMLFDYRNNKSINPNETNPIVSSAWSKKYGLVQYAIQDGTVFTRIDIRDLE